MNETIEEVIKIIEQSKDRSFEVPDSACDIISKIDEEIKWRDIGLEPLESSIDYIREAYTETSVQLLKCVPVLELISKSENFEDNDYLDQFVDNVIKHANFLKKTANGLVVEKIEDMLDDLEMESATNQRAIGGKLRKLRKQYKVERV
jgi:hypothetical protein